MKYTILVALLLCFVTVLYAFDGSYPRSDQSCQDKKVLGQYWDGQKCEQCANKHCYCDDYLACDKCQEGYSKYKIEDVEGLDEKNIEKCYKCPENVSECCFHGESAQFKIKENRENVVGDDELADEYLIRRALSCATGLKDKDGVYLGEQRRYGSYCHYEKGCLSYNNYGQCYSCAKGYYQSGTTYTYGSNKPCTACTDKNCAECTSELQCDVCKPNYYLRTNEGRVSHTDYSASECAKCNDNCLCSGKIGENDKEALCDLGCMDPLRYFKDESDPNNVKCSIKCPAECSECELKDGVAVCVKCYWEEKVLNKFHADKVNSENKCVECPSHCHKCTVNSDNVPTCYKEHCNNGYYESEDKNGVITCKKCSESNNGVQHIMRCNGKGRKDITQCGTSLGISVQAIRNVADITHLNDESKFYLVHAGKDNADCIENKNRCKKMDESSGSKALCLECADGYLLTGEKKCFICQDLFSGCQECKSAQQIPYAQCTKCKSGQDITDYIPRNSPKSPIVNYIISSTNVTCSECADGCLTCEKAGANKCDAGQCQSGYYFNEEAGSTPCLRCIENCRKCNDQENCTECWDGYTLWKSDDAKPQYLCVQCPKNCLECGLESESAETNRKTCTVCAQGYYLMNGVCHEHRENCMSYEDDGTCVYCDYKYRVIDGYCFPAMSEQQAYINIEYACGSDHRIRDDGDLLNRSQFEDYVIPISSQILSASALLIALLLTVF